jgi:hypothetical protein
LCHLSALVDSAADDAVDEDPAEQQTAEQLPLHAAHLADPAGDLQHSLAADTRTHKHKVKYTHVVGCVYCRRRRAKRERMHK